jgi:hypothetical protein
LLVFIRRLIPFVTAAWATVAPGAARPAAHPPAATPRLVVVVSIDQFRGDYLRRFDHFYGEGGFRRIEREGFVYDDCFFPIADTETGPGHSAMLTGAWPHRSGITQNDWFDAAAGRSIYCVEDSDEALVDGSASGAGRAPRSCSPRRLLASTVGDQLEIATHGRARTISLSLKDRAAILMGGHACDLVLWWDHRTGRFVTSTFYEPELPEWVVRFNRSGAADRWFRKDWALSRPASDYEASCGPDDDPHEAPASGNFEANVFPHRLGSRSAAPDSEYYEAIYTSPFGNDLLLELAKQAIDTAQLGADDVPDLLTVSFSANDPVGHAFGPDSWEVMDACIKTDAVIAELLRFLDASVGAGRWTLFLTADHGVDEFPETLAAHGLDADRVRSDSLGAGLEARLREVEPRADSILVAIDPPWVSIENPGAHDRLAPIVAEWLAKQRGVARALTVRELLEGFGGEDDLARALRLSYYPGRSGDVAFLLRPGWLLSDSRQGTSHGTPYRYDQFVPLAALGQGIRNGRSAEPVNPAQIAPTVAELLGVVPPNECEVAPLASALESPRR